MTGLQGVLAAFAGAAIGAVITAVRVWLLRRFTEPAHHRTERSTP